MLAPALDAKMQHVTPQAGEHAQYTPRQQLMPPPSQANLRANEPQARTLRLPTPTPNPDGLGGLLQRADAAAPGNDGKTLGKEKSRSAELFPLENMAGSPLLHDKGKGVGRLDDQGKDVSRERQEHPKQPRGVLKREDSDSADSPDSRRHSPSSSFRRRKDSTNSGPKFDSKQAHRRRSLGPRLQASYDEQVKTFCLDTGGNNGAVFGTDGCFAVGVQQEDLVHDMRTGVRKVGLFVPKGFAEGREVWKCGQPSKDMTFEEFLKPPTASHSAFGRISWDSKAEPANYIRISPGLLQGQHVHHNALKSGVHSMQMDSEVQDVSEGRWALPHMLIFFAERVWNLKPPKLVISMVGSSSTDFDMNVLDRNAIFHSVMNVAKETEAWITTTGIDVGIAKYVGEAKAATNAKVPIIGIAPWGLVEGRQALWDSRADGRLLPHTEKMPVENFSEYEKQYVYMKPAKLGSLKLNRDHTHFIRVDDDSLGKFGGESACRSGFESALHRMDYDSSEAVRESLVRQSMGWQRARLGHELRRGAAGGKQKETTAICICVQGGPHTVQKVLEAVRGGTPVLIVKGSGKTADLLADAYEFTERLKHRQRQDTGDDFDRTSSNDSQSSFASIFSDLTFNTGDDSSSAGSSRRELIQRLLTNDPDDEWLQADVQRCYGVSYDKDFDRVVSYLQEIAQSGLCQVFDIKKSQTDADYVDMSGSMLLCVLKKEALKGKLWHECLELVVQWNNEQVLKQVLRRLNINAGPVKNAFEKAFHHAFLHNKVALCKQLLEYGDVSSIYDVRRKPTITGALVAAGFNMLRKIGLEAAGDLMLRYAKYCRPLFVLQ